MKNKRYVWLINQVNKNQYANGAEVGCANGATTGRLLKYCPSLTVLFAVDKWEKIPDNLPEAGQMGCENWDPVKGKARFDKATFPYKNRLRVLKGDSAAMADKVPDNSLDFVFIDADHRYDGVKKDISAWAKKLKPGGLLSGHDIHMEGVKRAVNELLKTHEVTGIDNVWCAKKEDYVL